MCRLERFQRFTCVCAFLFISTILCKHLIWHQLRLFQFCGSWCLSQSQLFMCHNILVIQFSIVVILSMHQAAEPTCNLKSKMTKIFHNAVFMSLGLCKPSPRRSISITHDSLSGLARKHNPIFTGASLCKHLIRPVCIPLNLNMLIHRFKP